MRFIRISSQITFFVALACFAFEARAMLFTPLAIPQVPETSVAAASTEDVESPPAPQQFIQELVHGNSYPVRIVIPSIGLDASVENMGVNAKGEMDVPSGNTGNVGWYEGGTTPGESGSAVMDAHVYAAFKKLRYVKPGADIFVYTRAGAQLHFRAEESTVYRLADVPLQKLFNRTDDRWLNLITCAGSYSKSLETYTKRLIVYARLVDY